MINNVSSKCVGTMLVHEVNVGAVCNVSSMSFISWNPRKVIQFLLLYQLTIVFIFTCICLLLVVNVLSILCCKVPRGRYDTPCLPVHPDTPLCIDSHTSCQDNSFCLCTADAYVKSVTCGTFNISRVNNIPSSLNSHTS